MQAQLQNIIVKIRQTLGKLQPVLRHHFFIVVLALLIFLGYGVFTVNQLISQPEDDTYRSQLLSQGVSTAFDQTTIEKIRSLRKSDEAPTPTIPSNGRANPFAE